MAQANLSINANLNIQQVLNSIKQISVLDYANEVIEEENNKQKQKILDELKEKEN